MTTLMWNVLVVLHLVWGTECLEISEKQLDQFVGKLWDLEKKNVDPNNDYQVNLQGTLRGYDNSDKAPSALFKNISYAKINKKNPTIPIFVKLLDNYVAQVGVDETTTAEEQKEIDAFLDAAIKTPIMQKTYQFLKEKGQPLKSIKDFRDLLYNLWFKLYRRKSQKDSSAFEHVFVGEWKDQSILGLHNWIQFTRLERAGLINYKGHYKNMCGHPPRLITISFDTQNGKTKPKGSLLLGTTPEFEMAVYTVIFLSGHENVQIHVDNCAAMVQCHSMHGGKLMGTCYIK